MDTPMNSLVATIAEPVTALTDNGRIVMMLAAKAMAGPTKIITP
jgi:hypothetical protein